MRTGNETRPIRFSEAPSTARKSLGSLANTKPGSVVFVTIGLGVVVPFGVVITVPLPVPDVPEVPPFVFGLVSLEPLPLISAMTPIPAPTSTRTPNTTGQSGTLRGRADGAGASPE